MGSFVSISLFRYERLFSKVWAFGMMQFAHKHLSTVPGLKFYKLMGSGKGNGFNPYPDWSTYALLMTWDTIEDAKSFVSNSELFSSYRRRTKEMTTLYLQPLKSHGLWSGVMPFNIDTRLQGAVYDHPVLILTRASIKPKYLWKFWKYVPTSSKPIENNNTLWYTKGVGESPIIQMATISIWKDLASMMKFAYQSHEHLKAIKMTRELGWYSEELFARFKPIDMQGQWSGLEKLKDWFSNNGHKP